MFLVLLWAKGQWAGLGSLPSPKKKKSWNSRKKPCYSYCQSSGQPTNGLDQTFQRDS